MCHRADDFWFFLPVPVQVTSNRTDSLERGGPWSEVARRFEALRASFAATAGAVLGDGRRCFGRRPASFAARAGVVSRNGQRRWPRRRASCLATACVVGGNGGRRVSQRSAPLPQRGPWLAATAGVAGRNHAHGWLQRQSPFPLMARVVAGNGRGRSSARRPSRLGPSRRCGCKGAPLDFMPTALGGIALRLRSRVVLKRPFPRS